MLRAVGVTHVRPPHVPEADHVMVFSLRDSTVPPPRIRPRLGDVFVLRGITLAWIRRLEG